MNVSLSTDAQYRRIKEPIGIDRFRLVWAGRYRVRFFPSAYLSRVLTQISLKRFFYACLMQRLPRVSCCDESKTQQSVK